MSPDRDNTDRIRHIARGEMDPLERAVKRFKFWIMIAAALVSGGFGMAEWMHKLASQQEVDQIKQQVAEIEVKVDLIYQAVKGAK